MSFREVALRFFRIFLLICPFGHHEYFICKTLESVTVPDLVISLGVEDADAIKEAFEFIWPGLVLLIASWPLYHVDGMISFPLLVMTLG
jgi:hypothetical protein